MLAGGDVYPSPILFTRYAFRLLKPTCQIPRSTLSESFNTNFRAGVSLLHTFAGLRGDSKLRSLPREVNLITLKPATSGKMHPTMSKRWLNCSITQ